MFKLYLRRYVKVTSKPSAETRGVFRTPLNAYISAWELQLLVTIEREDHIQHSLAFTALLKFACDEFC